MYREWFAFLCRGQGTFHLLRTIYKSSRKIYCIYCVQRAQTCHRDMVRTHAQEHGLISIMLRVAAYVLCIAFLSISPVFAFHLPIRCSRPGTTLRAQESVGNAVSSDTEVESVPCPGYPKCDGEYRDKGCDGTGRRVLLLPDSFSLEYVRLRGNLSAHLAKSSAVRSQLVSCSP